MLEQIKTIGVILCRDAKEAAELSGRSRLFKGVSYCMAMKESESGPLFLRPDSIEVCRWSPPVLGLKDPQSEFEKSREPKLPFLVEGIFLSSLSNWPDWARAPEVVVMRTGREEWQRIISRLAPEEIYQGPFGIDRSVIPELIGQDGSGLRSSLTKNVNRVLDWMNNFQAWTDLTIFAFRREWTSRALNFVLDRSMANMSMCRNSTVIPYLTGCLNVSHFCTGGISWGRNPAHWLTGGMPYHLYKKISA